jgi:amino acid transporter
MKLLERYQTGGFYAFSATTLSPLVGFLAAWSYFIGKIASATLVIHIFGFLLQQFIPAFAIIPPFLLDLAILLFVLSVNAFGMHLGAHLQIVTVFIKFIPIIMMIIGAFIFKQAIGVTISTSALFDPRNLLLLHGWIMTIPMVLHASGGFESACLLSLSIDNPKKNAPRAVFFSYITVIFFLAVYQCASFFALGEDTLMRTFNFSAAFELLAASFGNLIFNEHIWGTLFLTAIAISALSSSFGMFFSNIWNIFTLAQTGHFPFARLMTRMNRFNIPIGSLIVEAIVASFFLLLSNGNAILLQQCSALGVTVAFTLSVLSLLKLHRQERKSLLLPLLGLFSCTLFIIAGVISLFRTDFRSFLLFSCLLLAGICMFSGVFNAHRGKI